MAKSTKKYELLQAVWLSGSEQLPVGTAVTFPDNEPTGIFIGRVRELTAGGDAIEVATPIKEGTVKVMDAQTGETSQTPAETSSDNQPAPAPTPPPAAKK